MFSYDQGNMFPVAWPTYYNKITYLQLGIAQSYR